MECLICPVCNAYKPKSDFKIKRQYLCSECFISSLKIKLSNEQNKIKALRLKIKELKSKLKLPKKKKDDNVDQKKDIIKLDKPLCNQIVIHVPH